MSKVFFDTNILAYACDFDSPDKQNTSRKLIAETVETQTGCISTQVLQEFYVTCIKKLGIEPLKAKNIIQSFNNLESAVIEPDDINKAIDGNILWQVSFRDALIICAADKLNCEILYSEDMNNGQIINGIKIINPFIEESQ